MRKIVIALGAVVVVMSLSGCGTTCNFAAAALPPLELTTTLPAVYGGVQLDAAVMNQLHPAKTSALSVFVATCLLADFPISFIGDTLTLPLTLWIDRRRTASQSELRGNSTTPTDPQLHLHAPSTAMGDLGKSER